jgi:hypothetical protein
MERLAVKIQRRDRTDQRGLFAGGPARVGPVPPAAYRLYGFGGTS